MCEIGKHVKKIVKLFSFISFIYHGHDEPQTHIK